MTSIDEDFNLRCLDLYNTCQSQLSKVKQTKAQRMAFISEYIASLEKEANLLDLKNEKQNLTNNFEELFQTARTNVQKFNNLEKKFGTDLAMVKDQLQEIAASKKFNQEISMKENLDDLISRLEQLKLHYNEYSDEKLKKIQNRLMEAQILLNDIREEIEDESNGFIENTMDLQNEFEMGLDDFAADVRVETEIRVSTEQKLIELINDAERGLEKKLRQETERRTASDKNLKVLFGRISEKLERFVMEDG